MERGGGVFSFLRRSRRCGTVTPRVTELRHAQVLGPSDLTLGSESSWMKDLHISVRFSGRFQRLSSLRVVYSAPYLAWRSWGSCAQLWRAPSSWPCWAWWHACWPWRRAHGHPRAGLGVREEGLFFSPPCAVQSVSSERSRSRKFLRL